MACSIWAGLRKSMGLADRWCHRLVTAIWPIRPALAALPHPCLGGNPKVCKVSKSGEHGFLKFYCWRLVDHLSTLPRFKIFLRREAKRT